MKGFEKLDWFVSDINKITPTVKKTGNTGSKVSNETNRPPQLLKRKAEPSSSEESSSEENDHAPPKKSMYLFCSIIPELTFFLFTGFLVLICDIDF